MQEIPVTKQFFFMSDEIYRQIIQKWKEDLNEKNTTNASTERQVYISEYSH